MDDNTASENKRISIFKEFGVSDPITVEMDSDTAAFLIQRAWRRYRGCKGLWPSEQEAAEEEVAQRTLATSGYMTTSISSCFSDMRTSNSFSDWRVSASNTEDNLGGSAAAAMEAEAATPLRSRRLEQLKEADSLSIMSDCSELMGEVGKLLKGQLTSQDALLRPRLHLPGSRSSVFPGAATAGHQQPRQQAPPTKAPTAAQQPQRGRSVGRDDAEDAWREQRKANFLSLAQEFAELKRRNADALPFNLHRLGRGSAPEASASSTSPDSPTPPESSTSPLQSPGESGEEEGALYRLVPVPLAAGDVSEEPQQRCWRREERLQDLFSASVDATAQESSDQQPLTEQHQAAADSDCEVKLRLGGLSERERVLQALSMSADDEDSGLASVAGAAPATSAGKTSATPPARRLSTGAGMEMCFRNDAASDSEGSEVAPPRDSSDSGDSKWQRPRRPPKSFVVPRVSEAAAPMQLCFISDLTSDEEDSTSANSSTLVSDSGIGDPFRAEQARRLLDQQLTESQCTSATTASSSLTTTAAPTGTSDAASNEDLLARQARLQAEAQLALAQARPMAKMQLEVERHEQRSRGSRDLVAELIGVSSTAARRFHRAHLQQLSVGALQLIHNDLLCRIEMHNEELVRSLIERDDLHMEQDSMLVEVEDLTRRAQEVANRLQEGQQAMSAAAPAASSKPTDSPVRRKMSSFTSRLKPNKLVSLFTGGN